MQVGCIQNLCLLVPGSWFFCFALSCPLVALVSAHRFQSRHCKLIALAPLCSHKATTSHSEIQAAFVP